MPSAALEPDQPVPCAGRTERQGHLVAGHRLGDVREQLGGNQRVRLQARVDGLPRDGPDGQPVPVGGQQRDRRPADLQPDPGEDGQRVVATGRACHLRDGPREGSAVDDATHCRDLRQRRVLVEGQGVQDEASGPAAHLDPSPFTAQLHRIPRHTAADVREQPARHQHPPPVGRLRRHADLPRTLVVEAGQRHLPVRRVHHHPGQNRHSRPAGQPARHPPHRLGQHLTPNPNLHTALLTVSEYDPITRHRQFSTGTAA